MVRLYSPVRYRCVAQPSRRATENHTYRLAVVGTGLPCAGEGVVVNIVKELPTDIASGRLDTS